MKNSLLHIAGELDASLNSSHLFAINGATADISIHTDFTSVMYPNWSGKATISKWKYPLYIRNHFWMRYENKDFKWHRKKWIPQDSLQVDNRVLINYEQNAPKELAIWTLAYMGFYELPM